MPFPLLVPLIMAAAGAASSAAASSAAKKKAKADQESGAANLRLEESSMDPFRHQMAQARNIGKLDMMEHASFTPRTITPPARYAGKVPTFAGGPSYAPSADVRSSAAALKQNVMAGQTAPTASDPRNSGRTGALDLLAVASGVDPTTSAARPAPRGSTLAAFGTLTPATIERYERQNPGWTLDDRGQPIRVARAAMA